MSTDNVDDRFGRRIVIGGVVILGIGATALAIMLGVVGGDLANHRTRSLSKDSKGETAIYDHRFDTEGLRVTRVLKTPWENQAHQPREVKVWEITAPELYVLRIQALDGHYERQAVEFAKSRGCDPGILESSQLPIGKDRSCLLSGQVTGKER